MNQDSLTPGALPTPEITASTGPPAQNAAQSSQHAAGSTESSTSTIPPRFEDRPVSNGFDRNLVQQTKDQIRNLIQEISEIAKSDCSVEEFYEGFLLRTTSALASVGGAIWIREPDHKHLSLHYQINLKQTSLAVDKSAQAQHTLLLNKLMDSAEPTLVPPNSGKIDTDEAGNPTNLLLVIAPLIIDQQPVGLVEILQRPGSGPATQRGYLRFLNRMATIASDFLKDQRLRSFSDQQSMWQKVEQFIKAAHGSLNPQQTAYTIANEGRRLVDCDRVSVALAEGSRMKIKAVSGLDTIERRAEQIKLLSKLTSTVCKGGEPLWYSGDSSDLPPQIEKRLHEYIDKSHSKMLAIIPMTDEANESDESSDSSNRSVKNLGALIVEQLTDARIDPTTENRVAVVAEHGQSALNNAIEHSSIFLMPVWRALGKLLAPFRRSNLPKTVLVLGLLGMIGFALCVVPYPFTLGSNGKLIPTEKIEVYANVDGTLTEITAPEDPYATVEKGHILATMINNNLMVEIEDLDGKIKQAESDLRMWIRTEQLPNQSQLERTRVRGQIVGTRKLILSLNKSRNFKQKQFNNLTVRSPIRGQVVNWQPRRTLLGRPVSRGQNLMTVVSPDTQWEIELEMPERRVGHLFNAFQNSKQPLKVNFALVSDPNHEFEGTVIDINRNLEVKSDDGNTATVKVRFDNAQVPVDLLRAGTRVRAKVQCGNRSVGYVLFHELIETTRTNLNYWF
jgi:multidrug resistance efflux pump